MTLRPLTYDLEKHKASSSHHGDQLYQVVRSWSVQLSLQSPDRQTVGRRCTNTSRLWRAYKKWELPSLLWWNPKCESNNSNCSNCTQTLHVDQKVIQKLKSTPPPYILPCKYGNYQINTQASQGFPKNQLQRNEANTLHQKHTYKRNFLFSEHFKERIFLHTFGLDLNHSQPILKHWILSQNFWSWCWVNGNYP